MIRMLSAMIRLLSLINGVGRGTYGKTVARRSVTRTIRRMFR